MKNLIELVNIEITENSIDLVISEYPKDNPSDIKECGINFTRSENQSHQEFRSEAFKLLFEHLKYISTSVDDVKNSISNIV